MKQLIEEYLSTVIETVTIIVFIVSFIGILDKLLKISIKQYFEK